jgi:hypothetical protein
LRRALTLAVVALFLVGCGLGFCLWEAEVATARARRQAQETALAFAEVDHWMARLRFNRDVQERLLERWRTRAPAVVDEPPASPDRR